MSRVSKRLDFYHISLIHITYILEIVYSYSSICFIFRDSNYIPKTVSICFIESSQWMLMYAWYNWTHYFLFTKSLTINKLKCYMFILMDLLIPSYFVTFCYTRYMFVRSETRYILVTDSCMWVLNERLYNHVHGSLNIIRKDVTIFQDLNF